jgi:DNA polymerase
VSDLREEAASIARATRRLLERERALTGGELVAAGIATATRKGLNVPELPAGAVAPVAVAEAAAAPVAAAPAPAMPSFTPPIAAAPAPPAAAPAPAAPRKPIASLSKAPPLPPKTPTILPEVTLPAFGEPVNPSALDGNRDAIHAAALPVLAQVASEANACTKCELCKTRTKAVPGIGSARSGIVFVGEAPGADEDLRGEPFVGRAGELLTSMIAAMETKNLIPGLKLDRENVYIVNVLKCRPPENRNPLPHEIQECSPYLIRQLEALQPRVICCLGKFAAELLLDPKANGLTKTTTLASMRGKTYRWRGAKLIVTYHPAYCLRSPSAKRPVWEDLQRLAQEYLDV